MVAWSELERTITGWHRVAQRRCGKNLRSGNAPWSLSHLKKVNRDIPGLSLIQSYQVRMEYWPSEASLRALCASLLKAATEQAFVASVLRLGGCCLNRVSRTSLALVKHLRGQKQASKCHSKQRITPPWKYLESNFQDESRWIWNDLNSF